MVPLTIILMTSVGSLARMMSSKPFPMMRIFSLLPDNSFQKTILISLTQGILLWVIEFVFENLLVCQQDGAIWYKTMVRAFYQTVIQPCKKAEKTRKVLDPEH